MTTPHPEHENLILLTQADRAEIDTDGADNIPTIRVYVDPAADNTFLLRAIVGTAYKMLDPDG